MAYKILVPVHSIDEHIGELVNIAENLARHEDSRLILLHVLPDIEDISELDAGEMLDDAYALLEEFAGRLSRGRQDMDFRIQMGNPAPEILKCIILERIDVIAMPTNGHTGINRLLLGSVAEQVMRHALCPVVTTRKCDDSTPPARSGIRNILLPLDGTEESTQIVPLVRELARLHDAEVILFYDEFGLGEGDYRDEEGKAARHRIDGVIEHLEEADVDVGLETTRFRNPAEEITRIVDELDIDLVAMITHGRSGLSRLVFGSVAEEYLHHSNSPLLTLSLAHSASLDRQ